MMELDIQLVNKRGYIWKTVQSENIKYFYKSLIDYTSTELELEDCEAFVVIKVTKDYVEIKSDVFRTIPIFYKVKKSKITISDNFETVSNSHENKMNEQMRNVYLNAGFTPVHMTLIEDVLQTRASESVIIFLKTGEINYQKLDTYNNQNINEEVTFDDFRKASALISNKLSNFLDGYTIYLPLSDGFDSLYIACLLKMSSFENVKCYSYGDEKSKVARKSRLIAENLGYEWHFYHYQKKDWKVLRSSKLFSEYLDYAGQASNFVHFQDFIAVMKISEKLSLEERENSIFIPGHTGTIGGGNLKSDEIKKIINLDDLINFIIKKDFSLQNNTDSKNTIAQYVKDELVNIPLNINNVTNFLQSWDIKERQSKMIVNSVRIYEFFGMKWYLPLQDKKLVNMLYSLDIFEKLDKKRYKALISQLAQENGITILNPNPKPAKIKSFLKVFLFKPYQFIYFKSEIIKHQFSWFSLFNSGEIIKFIMRNGKEFPAIMSMVYINFLEKKNEKNQR
ncbi:hypothetical protein [Enterococcus asini]|uniref:hypothetical protein n=1 Tax=Enterococcus asini TaxID=57732 RepID=UPI001E620833|nr:hypothetical protein [Enterococcus asini]MCD5030037.1 hypothetical protein [Enterococcus asini]